MSKKIVQLNEEVIKGQLKELVRGSVEETLNELLEAEAEKLTQAARYECNEWNSQENRTPSRPDHAAGAHCAKQTRLTSGGRLSSFAVLRRRRL